MNPVTTAPAIHHICFCVKNLQESLAFPDATFHRYGIGLQHIAFKAPSREVVDHLYRALQEKNAAATNPPREYPKYHEHYYAVYFKDPSGIQLEFCHTPGFEF